MKTQIVKVHIVCLAFAYLCGFTQRQIIAQQVGKTEPSSAAPISASAPKSAEEIKPKIIKGITQLSAEDTLALCSEQQKAEFLESHRFNRKRAVEPPRLVEYPQATYSKEARKKRIEGIVRIAFIVDKNGVPANMCLINSLGNGLDEQAALAVRQYRFEPAIDQGKPIPSALTIEVKFALY